jgi:hypothetical protein
MGRFTLLLTELMLVIVLAVSEVDSAIKYLVGAGNCRFRETP